jgi:3'-5' exoribonuclease
MRYIEELKEDERIVEHYYCKQKHSLKSRAGKSYLSLKLQDKTGTIEAKVWELNKDIQNFEENDYIKVDGTVLMYQNDLQLKVSKIRKCSSGEYEPSDYIRTTEKDVNYLINEIENYIDSLDNVFIKKLLQNIIINNEEINKAFITHSAAKTMHHGYMGGLIEHTLSLVQICDFMSGRYKNVNRDILIATAMLHDIGKIYELSAFPVNDYTDDGQLLGHIVMGTELITLEASKIEGFPHKLQSLIKHGVLSHHGEYEYGSPKKPKTIEALILHCADNMDSKINMFEEFLANNNTKGHWAGYHKMLTRNMRDSNFEE